MDASPTLEYFEELCYNLYIFAKLCKNWSVYCDDISYDWILDSDLYKHFNDIDIRYWF